MATNRRLSVSTRCSNALNLVNNNTYKKNEDKLLVDYKKNNEEDDKTITPTTTVTTNSFFSSAITTSTTATTTSTKQYNYYSNLISNTLSNNITDLTVKSIANATTNSKELLLTKEGEQVIKSKNGNNCVNIKSNKNKDVVIKSGKNTAKEINGKLGKSFDRDLVLQPLDKNFSSVLKGNYRTYRKKYLEGPVVGRGSFGVVRTLFSMVEILDLYQYVPTKIRPPINKLSMGIKKISANNFEFCGMALTSPTRAAKIMNFDKIKKTGPRNVLHILREVSIGSWNDHPNIVKVKEIYLNEQLIKYLNNINTIDQKETTLSGKNNNVYLVMEYCSGGDLSRLVINEVNKETTIPKIFLQIFRALSYINTKGIAHRDVKPENFLITHNLQGTKKEKKTEQEDITVKLADFGLANSSRRLLKTRAGTPYYVAPEIIKCNGNNHYSVKCDSWSSGIMLHIFLLGSCPFHDESDAKKLSKVVNEEIDWTHEIYATIPPEAYDLLKKLLVKNPSKRLSTTDALKHVYFQKFTGYVPMYRNIKGSVIIDKLIQFYKYPILKRVALCIMIRQISEYKLVDLGNLYKYLTTFSQDLNTLNIMSLTKYTNQAKDKEGKEDNYNDQIDKLYHLKTSIKLDEISFTEFVASQMAPELCQNNELIANVFAGLHSDLPGRRSLFINEQDLVRLTKSYTHDYSNITLDNNMDDYLQNKRSADTQIVNSINLIINDACKYSDQIYVQNKLKGNSQRLGGFLRSARDGKEASMSIDEFFLMMSFNTVKEYKQEETKISRIKRKKIK